MAYSSRSSTRFGRKSRILIPLADKIAGADFEATANSFFDELEKTIGGMLIPDRALARTAQLIYLPNRGVYYESAVICDRPLLALTPEHAIIRRREKTRAERVRAEKEAAQAREERRRQREAEAGGHGWWAGASDVGVIDHFNANHSA